MYTSATLALAAIEVFVHLTPSEMPRDLVAIAAEIPDDVEIRRLRGRDLPAAWRTHPAPDALAALGTDWVREGRTAVLAVPSAVIPQEENYLLNPGHVDFRRVRIGRPGPFRFDERMWKRRSSGGPGAR